MGINAALDRMRELTYAETITTDDETRSQIARDLTVVWESIDGWLSNGGCQPRDWYRA